MPDDPAAKAKPNSPAAQMIDRVSASEARMIRRKREGLHGWRAAALIGLIGWSVVLPMLVGIAIGTWIDHKWPSRISWTLTLLISGLAVGCSNAWNRIREEQRYR